MSNINRREFMKLGSFALASGLYVPQFVGFETRPVTQTAIGKSSSHRNIYVTGGWNNNGQRFSAIPKYVQVLPDETFIQTGIAAPVLTWFGRFAASIASGLVANHVWEWWKGLGSEDRNTVVETNTMLEDNSFNDYSRDKVHVNNGMTFYAIGSDDELNICAPFFDTNASSSRLYDDQPAGLVEGPTAVGLALAARDWTSRRTSKIDGLLPMGANYVPGGFESGQSEPVHIDTPAGEAIVAYRKTGSNRGDISVSSVAGNKLAFAKDYSLRW